MFYCLNATCDSRTSCQGATYLSLREVQHADGVLPAERLGPALGDGGALVDRVEGGHVAAARHGSDRLGVGPHDGRKNDRHQAGVALRLRSTFYSTPVRYVFQSKIQVGLTLSLVSLSHVQSGLVAT